MTFNMVTLLTEQDSEFPSLHEAASTLVKTPHCWKSHDTAHFLLVFSCGALLGPGDYGTGCERELKRLRVLNILLTCIDQLSHKKRIHAFEFGSIFYVPVNSYGHVEMVSSPNHTFTVTM